MHPSLDKQNSLKFCKVQKLALRKFCNKIKHVKNDIQDQVCSVNENQTTTTEQTCSLLTCPAIRGQCWRGQDCYPPCTNPLNNIRNCRRNRNDGRAKSRKVQKKRKRENGRCRLV